MLLLKLRKVIILVCLLLASSLISGCSHTIVKPQPLPLPVCPDLVQIHPTEIIVLGEGNVLMSGETMVKIVKRDAQRKACSLLYKAVIESTHVQ